MQTLFVTGGAGFIGSNFVRKILGDPSPLTAGEFRLIVLDTLTYAGNPDNLSALEGDPRLILEVVDIADRAAVRQLFQRYRPTAVVNFAAESHVDRSIDDASAFVRTNIVGAFELLEAARQDLAQREPQDRENFRFVHVSTDEVYGSLGAEGLFTETTPYAPNSPYAASKASADLLVRAYFKTYGLPVLVTNCSNNYGPYQFPEKLIPLMILNALEAKDLPIYGDGSNVRDWIFVEDHCGGILAALTGGQPGEKYNFGGASERTNLQVVDGLCLALEELRPAADNLAMKARGLTDYRQLKRFVQDRPGHDWRYAIDDTKARRELGWAPRLSFDEGLRQTVAWYLDHQEWCRRVQDGTYQRERLGLTEKPIVEAAP
jgi:dTDP-glucose 4,6-dehydratase